MPAFTTFSAHASDNSPDNGAPHYNGRCYLGSWFKWSDPPVWEGESPGYEHDLNVQDPNFFTSTCTSYSTLPDSYDDCPTAGFLDLDGPVFSFGTFDATRIRENSWYYGGWLFSSHGNAWYSPFKLQGQENESKCPSFIKTKWCMLAVDTDDLIEGAYLVWGGYPSWLNW